MLGGIGISFGQPRTFDTGKREFLLSVASECALALERARLFQRVVRDEKEQRRTAEILRFLVRGGMSAVFEARHTRGGMRAAVKVLLPPASRSGHRRATTDARRPAVVGRDRDPYPTRGVQGGADAAVVE